MEKLERPAYVWFRHARQGTVGQEGRLPPGWVQENWQSVAVDGTDPGPDGPSISITASFDAENEQKFYSLVLGDYIPVSSDDLLVMRFELSVQSAHNISHAYVVMREWIQGGTFVGQATRSIAMRKDNAAAIVGRAASGEDRVFQPLLTFQRAGSGAGEVSFTLTRLSVGSLYKDLI